MLNKNKLNKLNITILSFFLFLFLSISQCYSAPCRYIIWGFVSNKDSPVNGVEVVLSDVRSCRVVDVTNTHSGGLYMFWLYDGGGNYNVSISNRGVASSLGGTITVQENRAVRLDLDYDDRYMAQNKSESYYDYICYVSEYDNYYHKYGCVCLRNSCIPVPYGYALYQEQERCKKCLGQ